MSSQDTYTTSPTLSATESSRMWRAKNRSKCNEAAKRYRAAKREEIKARKTDDIRAKDAERARVRRKNNPNHASDLNYNYNSSDHGIRTKMVQRAKRRAAQKGIPFDLTPDDIIIPTTCPVLGIPIVYSGGTKRGKGNGPHDNSPSLDRLIPHLGYVKGNVRVISNRANRIRSDSSIEELEAIIRYMKLHCCLV